MEKLLISPGKKKKEMLDFLIQRSILWLEKCFELECHVQVLNIWMLFFFLNCPSECATDLAPAVGHDSVADL